VGADFLWAALSPTVRARVFVLDAADDLETLRVSTPLHFKRPIKPPFGLLGLIEHAFCMLRTRSKPILASKEDVEPDWNPRVGFGSQHFGARFKPGQRLEGATVLARDLARRTLDLTLRPHAGGGKLKVGSVLPGVGLTLTLTQP
jgi:hypothetical protein